jgi:hypothetical protein
MDSGCRRAIAFFRFRRVRDVVCITVDIKCTPNSSVRHCTLSRRYPRQGSLYRTACYGPTSPVTEPVPRRLSTTQVIYEFARGKVCGFLCEFDTGEGVT